MDTEADAISPFMTKTSYELYKSSTMDKDVIFYHTSAVRIKIQFFFQFDLHIKIFKW